MKAVKLTIFSLMLAGLFALPVLAQTGGQASGSQSGQTSGGDSGLSAAESGLIQTAAGSNLAEVALGQMAQQKATAPEVKSFAEKMVTDHQHNMDQVKALAQKKGISLSETLSPRYEAIRTRLQKLSGSAFDKAYVRAMTMEHRKDVAEFQKAQTTAKDSDVKSYVDSTLPVLQHHLQLAQEAAQKVAPGAASAKGAAADKHNGH